MRAIGIVGFKNSGKTTLARALARELTRRGHHVAAVKHSTERMDSLGKDTGKLTEVVDQLGFVSPQESGIILRGEKRLEEILTHLDADLVITEGFKQERTYPKIACLSGRAEDEKLFNGLVICAVGPGDRPAGLPDPGVPYLKRNDIGHIADLAEEKAFKLPALDCGGCGHENCYGMALEIVKGTGSADDCVSLHPEVTVLVGGKPLAMNPFIARLVGHTIKAMLSSLRDFTQGEIEIKIG